MLILKLIAKPLNITVYSISINNTIQSITPVFWLRTASRLIWKWEALDIQLRLALRDILNLTKIVGGFPWWVRQLRIRLQCGRPGFDPLVGNIPWRRAWQPTPVFLPGESPWTEEPGGLQSMEPQESDTAEWLSSKIVGTELLEKSLAILSQGWGETFKWNVKYL